MSSNHNATVETLASPCEDERIDVSIETLNGAQQIVLRQLTWTDGLGWCSQKTIRLDSHQLDELHRALTVARRRVNRRRAQAGTFETAQVIQLPTLN